MSTALSVEQRLDLRTVQLPGDLIIRGLSRRNDFVRFIRAQVAQMASSGEISDPKSGFGFATTGVVPLRSLLEVDLENPVEYIKAAFVDGDVPGRYAWNAVRKIYELLRLIQTDHDVSSTLQVVQNRPGLLRPTVPSENSDGTIPWGPFSWGGAIVRKKQMTSAIRGTNLTMAVMTAFSVWTQEEDNAVAERATRWLLNVAT